MLHKRFGCIFVIAAFTLMVASAQNDDNGMFISDKKVECVNKLVDWCNDMKYPKEGEGMSMTSIGYNDGLGNFYRIFCASDSDGTNCTKNKSPWFSCSKDHTMKYVGLEIKKDSIDGVDDQICNTTRAAFNDIFIQNMSFDTMNKTTGIEKGFESFFNILASIKEEMDILRKSIFNDCFPFCNYPTVDEKSSGSEGDVTSSSDDQRELE